MHMLSTIWRVVAITLRILAGLGGLAYAVAAYRYYDWVVRGRDWMPELSAIQETSAYTHGTFDLALALLIVVAIYVLTSFGTSGDHGAPPGPR